MDDKLEQLKKLYPDEESITEIGEYERALKKSGLMLNLLNHDGFKIIVKGYEDELRRINKSLQDEDLFQNEDSRFRGKLLHARKQWIRDFLKIFGVAKAEYGYTESKINSLLTNQ